MPRQGCRSTLLSSDLPRIHSWTARLSVWWDSSLYYCALYLCESWAHCLPLFKIPFCLLFGNWSTVSSEGFRALKAAMLDSMWWVYPLGHLHFRSLHFAVSSQWVAFSQILASCPLGWGAGPWCKAVVAVSTRNSHPSPESLERLSSHTSQHLGWA